MKTIVRGKTIEYGVDEKTGIFEARYNGEQYKHLTLAGLKAALDRQLKLKPLNIPVMQVEYDHFSDDMTLTKGIVVGVHSGNKNLLIKWEGKQSPEQFREYRGTLLAGNVDTRKLKSLYKTARLARDAYEKFKSANSFDRASIDTATPEEDSDGQRK